jgi:hypothetical protein
MNLVEKVILEWSYRCEKGYPDTSNEKDMELFESLFGFRLDEAVLAWSEFSDASRKYYRLQVVDNKIENKSPFEFIDGSQSVLTYADNSYAPLFYNMEVEAIKKIGGTRINNFPFFKDQEGNDVSFSALKKTKEFGGVGSKTNTSERQEHGLVDAINAVPGVKTIKGTNGLEINGVQSATKVEGNNGLGKEPYADVILKVKGADLKVSAKGGSAPTLAGGGLTGMSAMAAENSELREWLTDFYDDAYLFYKGRIEDNDLEGVNLAGNKLIPDVSRKIPESLLKGIVRGIPIMGGPIDYYYQGAMDVSFEIEGNTLNLKNGKFITVDEFIEHHGGILYAHLRKRDGDFYFTDEMQDLNGVIVRKIFKKPNSAGAQARFGTLDKIRGIEI